ncbi:MAG: hypothetical protein ABSF92_09480 [Candidatus Acidiferrales bacterium]|jgi:hypothetical protein
MLRKILIAFGLFILALIVLDVYFVHRIDSQLARDSREKLKKLEPRVIRGAGQFRKSTFYRGAGLGEVTEILVGWPADLEGAALTVVGNLGAHFLDNGGRLKKEVRFAKGVFCPVKIARLDASGTYGFLTRDECWASDAILFDKQGQERWSYPGGVLKGGVDDSVGGGLDSKGKLQVVIGFNGGGGVVLVNAEGKKIWQKADRNVWHVETLDINGDGRIEILHSNARGQLLVRDASGEIIAHYLTDHYVSGFALTRWGAESQARHILIPSRETDDGCYRPVILVLDAEGKTVAHYDAPLGDLMNQPQGTPVHFPKVPSYYAVLQSNGPLKRSLLFLYDGVGKIAYQEILADACFGIASMPGKTGDRLLVGCSGDILEYSPITDGAATQANSDAGVVEYR